MQTQTDVLPFRGVLAAACLLSALFGASSAFGQSYSFSVDSMNLEATIQKDGSARLDYAITFANQPGAHPIDIVDVGLPHGSYDLFSMRASCEGVPVVSIQPSTYIDTGVECQLAKPIPPGERGTFRFSCTMPDMVYQDTTEDALASFRIRPTWFDTQSTVGDTHLQIAISLPPGVKQEELKYQNEETRYRQVLLAGEGEDVHLVAYWDYPQIRLGPSNPLVGVSFPKRAVDRVIEQSAFDLAWLWWKSSSTAQWISATILVLFWWFIYFRFARGSGWILGVIVMALLIWIFVSSPAWHLLMYPILGCLCALNELAISSLKSQRTYMPAIATVEGGGIKRGLPAPLAAALLEKPLGIVATLVTFGLLKKGVLELTAAEPPTVRVTEPFRASRKDRLAAASKRGIALHDYEQPFIDILQSHEGPLPVADLREPLKRLLETLATQLQGFDLNQTKDYYRKIVDRAWKEAESLGELKQKREAIDRNFEWMAMDTDWIGRMGRSGGGYGYGPPWFRPVIIPSAPMSGGPAPAPSAPADVSAGDVAGSFAGWMEKQAGSLVSTIEPISLGGSEGGGGLVDLTGLDKVTSDVFEALASAKGGGGGRGGGGCACACAGCACACACAGGGR
ncbi:MAG TPA: hypothetical protein VGN57_02875 [Pirellulaceae bacterium]|jgi:hypothetical protein|nr:hypothetical protein [Pirellulaceae bacterium]